MRRFMLAALIGAATVAFTGVALAGSTATEPGMLYAVVKKSDGAMYYSPDGVYDPAKETLVGWNQEGVQGPPGPAGEQGPPGPAGETDLRVTQGSFTVPIGGKVSETLPLTGITVSGTTEESPPEYGTLLARPLLEAAGGMDVFVVGNTMGGPSLTSLLLPPVGIENPGGKSYHGLTVIATSYGATATITIGGTADKASGNCTFLWMAVETPN